jgi:hypothetical protein
MRSPGIVQIFRSGSNAFHSDLGISPIRVAADGGAFTGGKVRLVLHAMSFAAPWR